MAIEILEGRLREDVARVLGAGISIDEVEEIEAGAVRVTATVFVESRVEMVVVEAQSVLDASPALIEAVARLRLSGAWNRMITLT